MKIAKIIPIFNKRTENQVPNYITIFILSQFSKQLEKLFNLRLEQFLNELNIMRLTTYNIESSLLFQRYISLNHSYSLYYYIPSITLLWPNLALNLLLTSYIATLLSDLYFMPIYDQHDVDSHGIFRDMDERSL